MFRLRFASGPVDVRYYARAGCSFVKVKLPFRVNHRRRRNSVSIKPTGFVESGVAQKELFSVQKGTASGTVSLRMTGHPVVVSLETCAARDISNTHTSCRTTLSAKRFDSGLRKVERPSRERQSRNAPVREAAFRLKERCVQSSKRDRPTGRSPSEPLFAALSRHGKRSASLRGSSAKRLPRLRRFVQCRTVSVVARSGARPPKVFIVHAR